MWTQGHDIMNNKMVQVAWERTHVNYYLLLLPRVNKKMVVQVMCTKTLQRFMINIVLDIKIGQIIIMCQFVSNNTFKIL
jgi:hypothetical protein